MPNLIQVQEELLEEVIHLELQARQDLMALLEDTEQVVRVAYLQELQMALVEQVTQVAKMENLVQVAYLQELQVALVEQVAQVAKMENLVQVAYPQELQVALAVQMAQAA